MRYRKVVKVGTEKLTAMVNPDCPICSAKDSKGNELRLQIDKYIIKHNYNQTLDFCNSLGLNTTRHIIVRHAERHSPYIKMAKEQIKEAVENAVMKGTDPLDAIQWSAEEVIQQIINIGGEKIKTGEMEVSEKLLLGALKEQGTRKKVGTLEELLRDLDRKKFVEGEVLEQSLLEGGDTK